MNPQNNEAKSQQQQPKKKKEKTPEEKEEARKKAAEKKRLKKEQARLEEEKKKLGDTISSPTKAPEEKKKKEEAPKIEKEKKENTKETKKEKALPKKKFYALTTFEERLDELKKASSSNKAQLPHQQTNSHDISVFYNQLSQGHISSYQIIEMLSKEGVQYTHINEEIIIALVKIAKSGLHKQASCCLELLNGIKKFIETTNGDNYQLISEIRSLFEQINKIIYQIGDINGGLDNTCIYLRKVKKILPLFPSNASPLTIKNSLISKIDEYINTKILTKLIISDKTGNHLIKDNDFILIYGKSKVFRNMLLKAVQDGVKFKVAFVDNRKNNQIKSEIEYLTKLGITVVYTYLNGVSGIIKKVTKVFIKGKSMLSNGYLQGQVGTSLIACIANNFKKPVIAFCQTFKFWDKLMLDSLQKNNFAKTQCVDENDGIKYNQMELEYDITPANYINMVCCELGYIPPTSVPVVIREFGQKEIEL